MMAAVSSGLLFSAIHVPGAATLSFRAGVNGYTATQDTHVRDDQPGSDLGNATSIRVDGQSPVSHGLLRFDDLNRDGSKDLIVNVKNEEIVYLNKDGQFQPITAEERVKLTQSR